MTQEQVIKLAEQGHNIFLTGNAGTGKTYTLKKIISALEAKGKRIAKTATTGIAATHIDGITIHSWSGINVKSCLDEDKQDLYALANNKKSSYRIKSSDVLIIDEISMMHDFKLDMIDKILCFIRKNDDTFGGMQVILCGDFFQLPPVGGDGNNYAFYAKSWEQGDFKICYLYENHRQENDALFIKILNKIRNGTLLNNYEDYKILKQSIGNISILDKAVDLFFTNADVDFRNDISLSKLDTFQKTYESVISGDVIAIGKFMNDKNWLGKKSLTLKEGAKVMCLVNNFKENYFNGTLGEIIYMGNNPIIKVFKTGEEIEIAPYTWKIEEDDEKTNKKIIIATVTQIPLKLAWAMTINKSQGCGLDFASVDPKNVTENMAYVGISRVTSLSGLHLKSLLPENLKMNRIILKKDAEFQQKSQELEKYLD
jgi:ATP-dependent exoDNAse (exonuclease V) alpha subunit